MGIRIIRDRDQKKLWLCQDSYISKIIRRYHLLTAHYPRSPLPTDQLLPNDGQATPSQIYGYQQKISSAVYTASITRPDVAKLVNKLAEFLTNPSPKYIELIDRVIAYLLATKHYALQYGGVEGQEKEVFTIASDAAFADDYQNRRSSEGYLSKLFGAAVDWKATKQMTVTTSTTEAEFLAIAEAGKSIFWWKRLFTALQFDLEHPISI